MKKLLLLIIPVIFFACKKEEENPSVEAFSKIVNKYLACDSIKTTAGGIKTTRVIGRGKGYDMMFGIYASYTVFSTPEETWKFQFEVPNKLYYWKTDYIPEQFYTVLTNTTTKFVLQKATTDSVVVSYFTVEP